MTLCCIGLNHTTASIALREQLAFGPDILVAALRSVCQLPAVTEAVILSTCNRTELYLAMTDSIDPAAQAAQTWLAEFQGVALSAISSYLYVHTEQDAAEHLLVVACGLDSLILGEPQILGQVKNAFQTAQSAGYTGQLLQRLFQHAFSTAKQVRSETAIGAHPVSVAFAAIHLARQIFTDLREQSALLIGAGDTISLAARHLRQQAIGELVIANRTLASATSLAQEHQAQALGLTSIARRLAQFDIVVSATASPLPIIGKGAVEQALKVRRHRPMLMIDLAVPRDIEPEVADLPDVYLYRVDDLQDVIRENQRSRQLAAEQARTIVAAQVAEFVAWHNSLDAVALIRDYRARAEATRDAVLAKAQHLLAQNKPAPEVLTYLAHTLTNKLLHAPSEQLRQAASQGQEQVLAAADTLFQLNRKS
ncbi:MAG: glutamyl-tRNA reductase [Pseudomonadota bacterium]